MITAAQLDYLTEVLGAMPRANGPRLRGRGDDGAATVEAIVLTDPLNADEAALLAKILSSVGVSGHLHLQVREIPDGLAARHILAFLGADVSPKVEGAKWWALPRVSEMTGNGTDVQATKRRAWGQLQDFLKGRGG